MAYTPNEWGVGNLITASKMNKIERQLVANTNDLDDIRNGVTVPTYEEFENLVNNTVHVNEAQTLTTAQKDQARDNIEAASEEDVTSLKNAVAQIEPGLSEVAKRALLACFYHVAWTDDHGQEYYDALEEALFSSMAVILDSYSISLHSIGATARLTASTIPAGGSITWASSDSNIASVDTTGLVTSVGYGNAIITAFSGEASATCNVLISQITVDSIGAVYTQSGAIYTSTAINNLKDDLVVTAYMSDLTTVTVPSSNYTLSGTLTEGTSTITVSYGGKTTTFDVNVTGVTLQSIEAVFNQGSAVIYDDNTLDDLKQYLTVTARYNDGTSEVATAYELSGVLTAGTSTITASYGGKTTTFNVTVSEKESTIYRLPSTPLTLNGTSDFVDSGIQLMRANRDNFTVVIDLLSMNRTVEGTNSRFSLLHAMHETSPYPGFSIMETGRSGSIYVVVTSASSTSSASGRHTHNITSANHRIKLVVTNDFINNEMKIYSRVNNSNYSETVVLPNDILATDVTENMLIGCYQTTSGEKGRYFKGIVYDFAVYTGVWTENEAQAYLQEDHN